MQQSIYNAEQQLTLLKQEYIHTIQQQQNIRNTLIYEIKNIMNDVISHKEKVTKLLQSTVEHGQQVIDKMNTFHRSVAI